MTYPFFTQRLTGAMNMTIEVHGAMKRKGDDTPYVAHPFAVFGLLVSWDAEEDVCIAGLLHDVLEDVKSEKRNHYREEIRKRFGETVLEIIEGVTERKKSLSWRERKQDYLAHLATAPRGSAFVCCADKTHNTFCLLEGFEREGPTFWKRFNAPQEEKLWFYTETHKILTKRLSRRYTRELGDQLTTLRKLLKSGTP